jgi:hypothetical protein
VTRDVETLNRETTLNESLPIVPLTRADLPVDTIRIARQQPVRQRAEAVACAEGRGLSAAPVAAAAMDAALGRAQRRSGATANALSRCARTSNKRRRASRPAVEAIDLWRSNTRCGQSMI